jgi:hypothetical protein
MKFTGYSLSFGKEGLTMSNKINAIVLHEDKMLCMPYNILRTSER